MWQHGSEWAFPWTDAVALWRLTCLLQRWDSPHPKGRTGGKRGECFVGNGAGFCVCHSSNKEWLHFEYLLYPHTQPPLHTNMTHRHTKHWTRSKTARLIHTAHTHTGKILHYHVCIRQRLHVNVDPRKDNDLLSDAPELLRNVEIWWGPSGEGTRTQRESSLLLYVVPALRPRGGGGTAGWNI